MTVIALVIFVITYAVMFAFGKIRPYAALVSGAVFVILGSFGIIRGYEYTVADALGCIDWNVLMMIAGTMGTVYFFIESKMPQLMSDIIVSKVGSVKWLIIILAVFAGLISAFVDNVATVLMIAPVALAVCRKLEISPVPAIISISVSSNVQGAATLVGDTTSFLLAKAANLDFMDFFFLDGKPGMFWVTEVGALACTLVIWWKFRKEKGKVDIKERTEVKDRFPGIMLLLTIAGLIAVSFIPYESSALPGQIYKPDITNGIICLFFFVITALHEARREGSRDPILKVIREIDFYTILLLLGLFVVIGGITKAGVIDLLGNLIAGLGRNGGRGDIFLVYTVIVWMSVLISAFIDNIPYTATMLPVVAVLSAKMGADPRLFYFGLLVGATLGGNLTPIGASANIAGLGILRKEGYEVSSKTFMSYSVPMTLAAVITGYVLLWIIWM